MWKKGAKIKLLQKSACESGEVAEIEILSENHIRHAGELL